MNEKHEELLELLKVLKDLHGNGFHLTKEINAVVKLLLSHHGLNKEVINSGSISWSNGNLNITGELVTINDDKKK